jgi:hypothetical protein
VKLPAIYDEGVNDEKTGVVEDECNHSETYQTNSLSYSFEESKPNNESSIA